VYRARVELTQLRYFRAIALEGHMTRAARRLGVTQPALSAMLKKLEAEVGSPLVDRTGRGVSLTEAGRLFLQYAEQTLMSAEAGVNAVRELVGLERGSIRIGGGATAITYLLPPVISRIRARHPNLRFYIREAGSAQVAASVASGELDLGIVTLPIRGPAIDELTTLNLVEDELRLIVPADHPLSTGPRAGARSSRRPDAFGWSDLRDESVIGFEAGSAVREVIDRAAAAAGVALNVVMELRSIESIKQMVAAGIGVGLVSRFAIGVKSPWGEGLTCRESTLSRQLAIVKRRDRRPGAAAQEFERELVRALRPRAK
jgi:DNA-binding transcriptional LysR family regulator